MSGAMCRGTSCLMFKKLEDQNLGVIVKTPISNKEVIRSAIAFVDDTDFYTNGRHFMDKMQELMNTHMIM